MPLSWLHCWHCVLYIWLNGCHRVTAAPISNSHTLFCWEYLSNDKYLTLWLLIAAASGVGFSTIVNNALFESQPFALNTASRECWIGFEISDLGYCIILCIHIQTKSHPCCLCIRCGLYLMQHWLCVPVWLFFRLCCECSQELQVSAGRVHQQQE